MSNAEELAKYKKLLDDRVITQEDFDKKKEQLLNTNESTGLTTDNTWLVTLLLCFFAGFLGIHRFYVGKIGTGILHLLTWMWPKIALCISKPKRDSPIEHSVRKAKQHTVITFSDEKLRRDDRDL